MEIIKEEKCVNELRNWVENEVEFYGRTDEDFLLMFLRGTKFNMEKCKKKMTMYYENRIRAPQWWANRNLNDLSPVMDNIVTVILVDKHSDLPTLAITHMAKVSRSSNLLDMYIKQHAIFGEVALKRQNFQLNGAMWLLDWQDYPSWVLIKFFNPSLLYNLVQCFLITMPVRIKGIHVINFSWVARAAWHLLKSMLPAKTRKKIHFYGSDWSSLSDHIDQRLLPEEFGGSNSTLIDHQMAFEEELQSQANYFLDDDKFGFLLNK